MCVEADNTCLIRLRDIGKDAVDHADEHAVLERMSGIFDDRDDVRAVRSHVDQITSRAVGEFDCEDCACGSDDVCDVRDRGTGCGAEVEHFAAGLHVDVFQTTQDTCGQLGAKRVPDTVFGFGGGSHIAVRFGAGGGSIDGDALLAVDCFAGGEVLGDEEIFFAAGYKDTGVTMWFLEGAVRQNVRVPVGVVWHAR